MAIDLQNALANVNGASFIAIDTLTDVKLTGGKGNPFQGRVKKAHVGAQVMVFQNKKTNAYENMVQRRLVAEGKDPASFKLGARAWGERIPETPFITHKGELYLEVIFLKAGTTTLLVDGLPADPATIPGLPADPEPSGQGGLENQVIVRTFKAESIVRLRVNKQEYVK